ncbi:copper resistance CopC family protein [Streptosporangium roseum]|uniref:copper resistance CopC family protein n=1 Tax=Streptosporangium roseum TaxID=2001 RepID=UPI0004CDD44A|nr:copper resistance CopC family protein [Streptosporangium roseum]
MFLPRVAILLIAAVAAVWPVTAAQAHDILKSSNPAKDAKVSELSEVVLEFNNAVKFPKVVVLNAAEGQFQSGEADFRGKKVVQRLSGTLPPGKYTIGYRVVSSDGHPRTGEIPFTVIPSSAPTPTPSPASAEESSTPALSPQTPSAQPVAPMSTPQADEGGAPVSSGSPLFVYLVIGLGVVVAGFGVVAAGRRRRSGG